MSKLSKKQKWWIGGLSVGGVIVIITLLLTSLLLSIDTSIVNKLQHYTQTERTNDMFNPIIVNEESIILDIEVTYLTLNLIADADPFSAIRMGFARVSNPIISVYDWYDRGVILDTQIITAGEYDMLCDTPNEPINTHYTHFDYQWEQSGVLYTNFTYVVYVDFIDANGNYFGCYDVLFWLTADEAHGQEPPLLDIPPTEDELEEMVLNCDHISFFEYEELETTPTPTPTPTNTTNGGCCDGTWWGENTIFSGMKNWASVLILSGVSAITIASIISTIVLIVRKKRDE